MREFFQSLIYKSKNSVVHRIDPRVKLVYLIAYLMAIFHEDVILSVLMFLTQIPVIALSRCFREWLAAIRSSSMLIGFIFAINVLTLTHLPLMERIRFGGLLVLKIIIIISAFSVFFSTTKPEDLSSALRRLGVPYKFCFMLTTTIRSVPLIAEEAISIMDAQRSRGIELDKGNIFRRIKNYAAIIIPLILSCIRRSQEMAEAMEARGWSLKKKRTEFFRTKVELTDYIFLTLSVGVLAVNLFLLAQLYRVGFV